MEVIVQNAHTPGGSEVDPPQRTDAAIRSDRASADPPVRFGVLQGQAWIADDFDAPLPDYLLDAFEGR
ncbi:hypothetical protein LGN17_21185 [Burkholderia sp. AU30280]|uniref:hypothetical protein n=1 Tax=Burkholderia sp. AU30280 TaxID=2879628 RepID=UPI001CF3E4D5|nr:hypothetical protein [Burkholderia sp. AU30280]MCA8275002.1 hypothetical protein [Burkholderia sp. AU30280]